MQVTDDMVRAALAEWSKPNDPRDHHEIMRAALEAALAHMWRPVSEAETNTPVIVFCPEAAEHTQTMICARLEFEGDPNDPEWFELNCEDRPNPIDVEPTHFMPLPAPPKTGGE